MDDERLDLGVVESIAAEAIGEPGKRTFRVTPAGPRGEAVVWMEKEQLFQIGLAIKQFIITIAPSDDPAPYEPDHPREDLLRHKLIQIRWQEKSRASLSRPDFVTWCAKRLERCATIHHWLVRELT